MKEKSYQHVISYSPDEFCIEGTWVTNCTHSTKSKYNPDEEIIRSPPIFYQSHIFYLSFYFDTNHKIFMLFIEMEEVFEQKFPVSVKLTMKNLNPKNTLNFQSQFYFTPQAKYAIATFNQKTSLDVFSDEGFSFDGFFIIQYSLTHKKPISHPRLNFESPRNIMSIAQRALIFSSSNNLYQPLSFKNNCQYAGLCNQGATCYLNSILQALFHIPAFRSLVFQIRMTDSNANSRQEIKKSMIYNLQKLFAQMMNSNTSVSTKDLTVSFGWTSTESFRQNDAQELLRVFLESLEKKLKHQITNQNPDSNNDDTKNENNNDNNNDIKNKDKDNDDNNKKIENSISDMFKFQVIQTIECPNVSFRNTRVDDYLDLTVEVRGCKDLYQSMKKFTSPEKLDSPYSTEEFGPQKAIMYNQFKTLPKVLFIHLKRFEYRQPGITEKIASKISSNPIFNNQLMKINDRFEFPTVFDFSEFVEKNDNNVKNDWIYELFGVLVHSGSATFGHYYAYLRPSESHRWYKFNDSFVNECSEAEAVNSNYGDATNCSSGYMLIYMRRNDLPQLFAEAVQPPENLLFEKEEENIEPVKDNRIESKDSTKSDSIFYNPDKSDNFIEVKIITDQNLRDGCDECSLSISNINNDGYYRGKNAPFIFHDCGIIRIHHEATESELLKRVSEFYNNKENCKKENDKLSFNNNSDEVNELETNLQKEQNNDKFDLYMMNCNEGTVSKKITPSDDRISYFGQNNIYVFYRSTDTKKKSIGLNIDNYLQNENDDNYDEASEKEDSNKITKSDESPYYPYLDIDNKVERLVKLFLNASLFVTSSVHNVVEGTKDVIKMNLNWNKKQQQQQKMKSNSTKSGDKILIFLKVFDYKRQEIRFLKSKNVYHDDKLSILFDEANEFFFPDGSETQNNNSEETIKFYMKKFSTIYDKAFPEKTFKENMIYNGCIIIMQNSKEDVKIVPNKPLKNNSSIEEKAKNLPIKVETPKTDSSLLDYIDTKYNMCDAIVSDYDTPSQYLFVLRFSFNCYVSTLKETVAKAAEIDLYDPQKNSIILYTQHLNSKDEPNTSPLSYSTRITSPYNRLFFRFFNDTPESKISLMTPIKVWINDIYSKTVLASKSGIVKDVVKKIFDESKNDSDFDEKLYEISLDKSGALLCEIPSSFKIFNIKSNCSIHVNVKDPSNNNDNNEKQLKIAVCHTKGINLFVPFFFTLNQGEEFSASKERLKEEIEKHASGNKIESIDKLEFTLHHLNKSLYDTMMPTSISDNQILFDIIKKDKTGFLFVELPKNKVKVEDKDSSKPKKNNSVIVID